MQVALSRPWLRKSRHIRLLCRSDSVAAYRADRLPWSTVGYVGSEQLAWSGRDWRMPVWLWVGLAAMFVSALHIIIDFGVGLFDLHGTLTLTEAATLVGVALIQVWWAISFIAGARGNGSGVASVGILGAGWAALTNGFPIVYCPPVCEEARPLTDLGHVGSIMFGILLALVAI